MEYGLINLNWINLVFVILWKLKFQNMKIFLLWYFETLYCNLLTYLKSILTPITMVMSVIKQHNNLFAFTAKSLLIVTFHRVLLKCDKWTYLRKFQKGWINLKTFKKQHCEHVTKSDAPKNVREIFESICEG